MNIKLWLKLALTLMVLAAFTGLATAQPAPGERKIQPRPAPAQLTLTGKVTAVNPGKHTFTVVAKGQPVTFSAPTGMALPAVGGVYDITYTPPQKPGEAAKVTTVNNSKSNTY